LDSDRSHTPPPPPQAREFNEDKVSALRPRNVSSGLKQSIYTVIELPSLTHVELEKASIHITDLKDLLCHAKYLTILSLNGVSIPSDGPPTHIGKDKDPAEAEEEKHGLHSRVRSHLVSLRLTSPPIFGLAYWTSIDFGCVTHAHFGGLELLSGWYRCYQPAT
jgi:hypothetical protein